MQELQELLAAARAQTVDARMGDGCRGELTGIEFLTSASMLQNDTVYLLGAAELPELLCRGPLPGAAFFVCCGDAIPALPETAPAATLVLVRAGLLELYSLLNGALSQQRTRRRTDDYLRMAENIRYSPEQLVLSLSLALRIGLYILNDAYQRVSGIIAGFSGDPYAQELSHDGGLSAESVRRIREGRSETPAMLYEAPVGRWSRFFILLLWHGGSTPRVDPAYLCRRTAEYVISDLERDAPSDIPALLTDPRLNRILSGKATDAAAIMSYLGIGDKPLWFSVLVLDAEPGTHWNAEACQRQANLLHSAFRDVMITVLDGRVCALSRQSVRIPRDQVIPRSFFCERDFAEGWDAVRLEQALSDCGVYLCCSVRFRSWYLASVMYSLVSDALKLAIRLDGCRGRRIIEYQDYNSDVFIKYAAERFLQTCEPRHFKAVICPELVTLLGHDARTHGDLARTLYMYYVCGDAKSAAQALYVHRNTVYNKLKTVQQLLGVDLDEPAIRSSYFSSLQTYYYCERCLGLDMEQYFAPEITFSQNTHHPFAIAKR